MLTIPLAVGLAFVLGADVGSALASQLFTFNIKSISPLLLLIGFLALF
jgi:Na+/phosphate symporter